MSPTDAGRVRINANDNIVHYRTSYTHYYRLVSFGLVRYQTNPWPWMGDAVATVVLLPTVKDPFGTMHRSKSGQRQDRHCVIVLGHIAQGRRAPKVSN